MCVVHVVQCSPPKSSRNKVKTEEDSKGYFIFSLNIHILVEDCCSMCILKVQEKFVGCFHLFGSVGWHWHWQLNLRSHGGDKRAGEFFVVQLFPSGLPQLYVGSYSAWVASQQLLQSSWNLIIPVIFLVKKKILLFLMSRKFLVFFHKLIFTILVGLTGEVVCLGIFFS